MASQYGFHELVLLETMEDVKEPSRKVSFVPFCQIFWYTACTHFAVLQFFVDSVVCFFDGELKYSG
jgi:hypothetical protein